MISYVLPTHDRPAALAVTLEAVGRLGAEHAALGGAEVIIVDNGSAPPVAPVAVLGDGTPVRVVRLDGNLGAAARNDGVRAARGEWIVMLDDDSHPTAGLAAAVRGAADDVAAVGADIRRLDGRREQGGLPEVVVGCGAAVRRDAFLAVGGYDASFGYYVEEYDLCAKLIAAGWRITHDVGFLILHRADAAHRDIDRILHRLVRNSAWVMQRYAPESVRGPLVRATIERYAAIAVREGAARGFATGVDDLARTIDAQPRRPLAPASFDRFTGLAAAREMLARTAVSGRRIALVDRGKNDWAVERAVTEHGGRLVADVDEADALAIGTLSPGPARDAAARWAGDGRDVITWVSGRAPHAAPAATAPGAIDPAGAVARTRKATIRECRA